MTENGGEDLEERIAELERALEEIRDELRRTTPRGPLGLPRPPTPREVLTFADEAAIPAAIAILEANIRILEALRRTIRLRKTGQGTRDRADGVKPAANAIGNAALDRFDAAIADLERLVDGTPSDVMGGDIVRDARELRDELETRVSSTEQIVDEQSNHAMKQDSTAPGETTTIDVDAELESIKREFSEDDEDDDENKKNT